jgi:hypothetical protein
MTPQEKAKELIIKFLKLTSKHEGLETAGLGAITVAKQCALIAVDEIIEQNNIWIKHTGKGTNNY